MTASVEDCHRDISPREIGPHGSFVNYILLSSNNRNETQGERKGIHMNRRRIIITAAVATSLSALSSTYLLAETSVSTEQSSSSISQSASTNVTTGAFTGQAFPVKGPIRSSELIGSSISNSKGEMIGSLSDFLIDPDSGKLKYALLDIDKGMSTAKTIAIPIEKFSRDANANNKIVLNLDKSQLAAAPQFDVNSYSQNSSWNSGVDSYYSNLSTSSTVTPTGVDSTSRSYDSSSSSSMKSESTPSGSTNQKSDSQNSSSSEENRTTTTP